MVATDEPEPSGASNLINHPVLRLCGILSIWRLALELVVDVKLGHPHPLPRGIDLSTGEVGTGVELQPLRDDPPNEMVVKGPAPLSDDLGQRPEDVQLRGAESKTNRRTISDTAQVGGKSVEK